VLHPANSDAVGRSNTARMAVAMVPDFPGRVSALRGICLLVGIWRNWPCHISNLCPDAVAVTDGLGY
jgi:hypothetical protein